MSVLYFDSSDNEIVSYSWLIPCEGPYVRVPLYPPDFISMIADPSQLQLNYATVRRYRDPNGMWHAHVVDRPSRDKP